eukprot:jgi/Tetstr1/425736/TSEL_016156.t1
MEFMPCAEHLEAAFETFSSGSENDIETSGDAFHSFAESRSSAVAILPRCCSSTAVGTLPWSPNAPAEGSHARREVSDPPGWLEDSKPPPTSIAPPASSVLEVDEALAFELGHGQALMSQLSHAEEPLGVLGFETIKVVASTESKGKSCSKKRKAKTPEPTTPSKQARAASGIKLGTSSKTSSPLKKSRTYGQLMYVSAAPEAATSAGTDGPASDADDEVVDDEGKSKGKNHNPWYRFWTLEETQALVDGVDKCGGGKWADIKKLSFSAIDKRSAVDLKDKWRNLIRIAMLPAEQVKLDKKREATCPPELLQQVRDISKREELRKHNKVDGRMNRGRPRTTTETAAGH